MSFSTCRSMAALILFVSCMASGTLTRSFEPSLPPQLFKPPRIGCRIHDGVLNIPVAEIILNEPRIRASIRQSEATGMAQHVRVGGQGKARTLAIGADCQPRR